MGAPEEETQQAAVSPPALHAVPSHAALQHGCGAAYGGSAGVCQSSGNEDGGIYKCYYFSYNGCIYGAEGMGMNVQTDFSKTLKLVPVGNSTGLVIPKDMLARQNLKQGDQLYAVETPEGIELRLADPEFVRQMEIARGVMDRHRDALAELAK